MSINRAAEPLNVIQLIEDYATDELEQVRRYENRDLLDQSGMFSLHRLAAQIYQLGFNDGESAEAARARGERQRQRDAATPAPALPERERGDER